MTVEEGRRRASEKDNQYVMEIEDVKGGEPKHAIDARTMKWSDELEDGTLLLNKGRFLNLA